MMTNVNRQIQWAISDAISNQILSQIQNALKSGSGHLTQNRWNAPTERPEITSAIRKRKKIQEVKQSVNVLMANSQTKLTTW